MRQVSGHGMEGLAPAGLEIIEELGRGAQTVVYRARRRGVDYALKVLRGSVFADEAARAAFGREAAMLTAVAHPGLTRIHEVGLAYDRPYLVMELLDGQTLASVIEAGPLDEARAAAVAADVAAALAAAHRVGLVHRDVKPDNIMIRPDGQAKVIDFGLAAHANTRSADTVAGTFAYTAPEQTGMLTRLVDGRADLYALGVVLFQGLTGRLPFDSSDVGDLIREHAVVAPPDPRELRPDLSDGFAAIVARLLAKDPDDRYQTGDGLVADLHRLRAPDGAPILAALRREAPAQRSEAELIGREEELAALLVRWHAARDGHGGVALVCGAPGAGKSRLVREVLSAAAGDGALVLRGKCQPDEAVPLAPLRMAVEAYLRDLDRLPEAERERAVQRVRAAAGRTGALLRPLSPALAALIDAPEVAEEDRDEQFATAVGAFLAELARVCGGAVIHLDDVQWLDAATRRVLLHLAADLPQVPLLVAGTARNDEASAAATAAFDRDLGGAVQTRLDLLPLDDDAMARLVAATLGGATVTRELTAQIVARSGGNPFTAGEYLRAILDAGVIRPSWGVWVLEEGGLDRLALPDDVLDLVIARIDGLGGQARALLAAAAAMGMRFTVERLAEVCGMAERDAFEVVGIAAERRLVGPQDGGYVFLHDRIREALLADVEPDALSLLHRRVAAVLDAAGSDEPADVYAVARHYALGGIERAPGAVFRTNLAAGRLALAQYAAQEALGYLETAAAATRTVGFTPDPGCAGPDAEFHGSLGLAYLRTEHFSQARPWLERALAAEPRALRRAALWGHLCELHQACTEIDDSIAAARRGLAELRRGVPANPLLLVLTSIWWFLAYLAAASLRIGVGTATGELAERFRLESTLLVALEQPAGIGRRMLLMSCLVFRTPYPGIRLGTSSPESVRAQVNLGSAMWHAGRRAAAERVVARAAAAAARIGDPVLIGHAEFQPAMTRVGVGRPDNDALRRLLTGHGRWLSASEFLATTSCLVHSLSIAGHANEAREWWQRGRHRLHRDRRALGNPAAVAAAGALAMLGRDAEAVEQLRTVREFVADHTDSWEPWVQYVLASVHTAVELGELDALFDTAVADMQRLGITPKRTWPTQRYLWIYLAYGQLARCHAATGADRTDRLADAKLAVDRAAGLVNVPEYRTHHRVLQAMYRDLAGDPAAALRLLHLAEEWGRELDSPVLDFEIARLRARALRRLGREDQAGRQVTIAEMIATEHGWEHRARWIRTEFGAGERSRSGRVTRSAATTVTQERYRRRMDALQQVGLAAATVIDPDQLARVALDETLSVFGAERALLFLADEAGGQLVPHLGRDSAGRDIDTLTGYSATLVERVRDGADALVVTGDEDGRTITSQSAVVHGLRSIMVAPLRLKDRLLGVVYLDSRVAKGIFTEDDVDILVAITNHVAVSLETARAAQLEVAVHAARQQRDLAETLRSAMSRISSTLDADQVLARLLDAAGRALSADAACLVRRDGARLTVAAVAGDARSDAVGQPVDSDSHTTLAAAIGTALPRRGTVTAGDPAPLPGVLPGMRSWLAVPLATREGVVGLIVIASTTADAYADAHLDIVATLAGQGAVAYDNAVLFERVHQLATEDGLTKVANRRHVLELAEREFAAASSTDRPLTAIMIDIDHFKWINDTHGHLVGDQVIAEVATRLRGAVRPDDLLGRYGGEEFVLVLSAARDTAHELAERIRTTVNGSPVHTNAGPVPATVSVGVACIQPTDRDLGVLLGRADRALYVAKEQGRDRVAAA